MMHRSFRSVPCTFGNIKYRGIANPSPTYKNARKEDALRRNRSSNLGPAPHAQCYKAEENAKKLENEDMKEVKRKLKAEEGKI